MLTSLYVRARNWMECDEGASAVEYGLLVAGIAVAIIVIVFTLGDEIATMFGSISDAIAGSPRP
jgi:pilus assembly protein Flp/PilA